MTTPRTNESGFAMLFVFVLAAIIAITMYMELPRVAFESQRAKEQLLIDRGEGYKRGIQVFFRKNHKYPQTLDELESYQNLRYLRKRYKDPMTGKDEWRLIHTNGMTLTDSLVQKAGTPGQPGAPGGTGSNSGNGMGQSAGSIASGAGTAVNAADPNAPAADAGPNFAQIRRPSDRIPGAPGSGLTSSQFPGQYGPDPNQGYYAGAAPIDGAAPNGGIDASGLVAVAGAIAPGQTANGSPAPLPGQPGYGVPAQPGLNANGGALLNQPGLTPNGAPLQPGQPGYGVQPGQPGFPQNGAPVQPGQPGYPPGQYGAQPGLPPAQTPGQVVPGQGYASNVYKPPAGYNPAAIIPPAANGPGGNPAIAAIQQSLTGGNRLQGGFNASTGAVPGRQAIGGGIAGVATTFKGTGIKVVNERSKYQEWEFVYDPAKDKTGNGGQGQQRLGQPIGGPLNQQGPNSPANPASPSPFNTNPAPTNPPTRP